MSEGKNAKIIAEVFNPQDHYVTRNSTTDDPSGYRVWMTCRCGWDSGTLPDGNLPTTHRAEVGHYLEAADARNAELEAEQERIRPLFENLSREYPHECNKRVKAENDRDAALAIIERAPHTIACRSASGMLADRCDCWKANPYRATPEPKEGE